MLLHGCFVFLVAKMGDLCSAESFPWLINIDGKTYMDPKYDFVADKIFKDDDLLLKFINSALCPTCKDSQSQRYSLIQKKTKTPIPDVVGSKQFYWDVLCESNAGDEAIVEIQFSDKEYFDRQAQYYVSSAITNQLPTTSCDRKKLNKNRLFQSPSATQIHENTSGTNTTIVEKKSRRRHRADTIHAELRPVHFIGILDYVLSPKNADFISTHLILDSKTKENFLNLSTYTFIELPKLEITKGFKMDQYETFVEKMSYLFWFKRSSREYEDGLKDLMTRDSDIGKAVLYTNAASWTQDEKMETYTEE